MKEKKAIRKPDTQEHKVGYTAYEEVKEFVDSATGEIITSCKGFSRTQEKEPDYIKIYLNTMMAFQGVEGISAEFMLALCNCIDGYVNSEKTPMIFRNDLYNKNKIANTVGVSTSMVAKQIKKLADAGILIKSGMRSIYYVNPFLIARGKWQNIKKLQLHFDIVNGVWQVDATLKPEDYEEEEQ